MASRYELLHWCDYTDDRGRVWPCFFADELEFHPLRDCYGISFGPPGQGIFINIRYSKAEQSTTLWHEQLHASLWSMRGVQGAKQERVCTTLEKSFFASAKRNGWKAPERPEGYERMRRRAVRNYRKTEKP